MIRVLPLLLLMLLPVAAGAEENAAELPGKKIYQRCAACHLPDGAGVPGAYPPLAGHIGDLLAAEGGRAYVVAALDRGAIGNVEVAGVTYRGMMPAQTSTLKDEDVTALLNYLVAAFAPDAGIAAFEVEEVNALRAAAKPMTAKAVHEARPFK